MNKLDTYISRQFLNTLIFAIIAFCIFFIIVDLVEYMDKFIDKRVSKSVVFKYYLYYLPYIFELIMPIAILLASLFSIGQLARYNELTAMQTSGISLYRLSMPLLTLGLLISIFMILFGEYVVPVANQKRYDIKREQLDEIPGHISSKFNNITILQGENKRTNIAYFDNQTNVAHDVSVQRYNAGKLKARLDARRMVWRKDHWVLINGIHRIFQSNGEIAKPFSQKKLTDFPVMLKDLKKAQKKPDEMNYTELKDFIAQIIRNGGDPQKWLVELHLKIAFPFTNFIIILFGIPLASLQRRSGAALGFGISLAICFIFFGLVKTFQAIGHNGILSPFLSAWGSDFIFAAVGIFLMIKVRK